MSLYNGDHAAADATFFRVFRSPTGRWTWVLWGPDREKPLVHGRDFESREEAIANTVAVTQAAANAGWATDLNQDIHPRVNTRWKQLSGRALCSEPGCQQRAVVLLDGTRARDIDDVMPLCRQHAEARAERRVIRLDTSGAVTGARGWDHIDLSG